MTVILNQDIAVTVTEPAAPCHPPMMELLKADLRGMSVGHPQVVFWPWYLLTIPAFLTMFIHRASVAVSIKGGKFGLHASRLLWRLNVFVSGCDIMTGARIGPALSFPHPMGIVIGEAVIGRNATILQHVTIGKRKLSDSSEPASYPVIGDNVTIMAGAVVAGRVRIGDGATIGANSVVLDDIPPGAVAVGCPARVITKDKK
jgi:serine O-acetyltransferase